jgi:hypothetical protein
MRKPDLFRSSARSAVATFALLILVGCSKPPPNFQVKLEAVGWDAFNQYKLVVDGVPVGPLDSRQPYQFVARGHSGDAPQDMLPHIEASVLYVCGWQPAKIEMHPPSRYEIEQARKEKRSIPLVAYLDFERPSWQEVTVLMDNRSGPAARLAVGEFERPVAAGDAGRFTFPYWPHCDQATELRLNGESIGKIEEDSSTPGTAHPLLLDTSGAHCYVYEWQTYGAFPSPSGGHAQQTYKPQRLRSLSSHVDYFLRPLPSVEYSTNSVVQKSSLNETACK